MSATITETERAPSKPVAQPIVNDVVITVATSNGTGSQSANLILMRSIFNMGIPVSGKNMFPSNIQGLPTWFTIRANQAGWTARRRDTDFLIAMNAESAAEDIASLQPGAILILNESLKPYLNRDDLQTYIVPFDKLVVDVCKVGSLRKMVVNIMYVGVIAYLLDMDMDDIKAAVDKQFSSKPKAAEMNKEAAVAGHTWAKENLQKQTKFALVKSDATKGKIIIEGNQAGALGLLFGGIQVVGWYPITPSSSLAEALIDYLDDYRRDPETGKATYAVIQAEDELASMAIVVGAGWAGARSATTTAGPGISLMSELAGLAYFAEIPSVIIDVQRVGPSTGLPTRTCQSDIIKAYNLSHGDCNHPLLLPGSVAECFEFCAESLNLAERLQTLVFVMMDLDLGMNSWMSDPFKPIEKPIDRGKVLSAEDLTRIGKFARYKDVDGDGICYRTLPGTNHPLAAYFTRGTGHTEQATYSEKPHDWQNNMDRLKRKFDTARKLVPQPVIKTSAGAEIGIIAYGSSDPAVEEARYMLSSNDGIETDYLRLRGLPVDTNVRDFIASHRVIYLVEQNRDAQVASILKLDFPELTMRIKSVLHYNGLPIDAQSIVDQVLAYEQKENGKS
ncbi:2-oxoacid:acceptor oxidoreductase subunit alpha [Candidatus Sumerlaeota bacterium]|nr:2-oxoacid:acceptor oxidoreductase subunit alpha [Candidatus Sumerlaeota bacterium]